MIGDRTLVVGVALGIAAAGACTSRTTDNGIPATRSGTIFGGSADSTHDAVMALLQMETATTAYACSGTTIAQTGTSAFLLTAAHCVVQHDAADNIVLPLVVADPMVMTVLPGPDLQASYAQGHKFTVAAISVAPGYDGSAESPDDMAIVRFTTSMPSLPLIPILEPADDTLAVGAPLTLVGYGVTETNAQNSVRRTVDRPIETLTATQLRYLQNDTKGHCTGDSGGPALTRVAGAERVAGVIAFSTAIPDLNLFCTLEGASVRVSSLAAFVHSIVGVSPPDAGAAVDAADGGGGDASVLPDAGGGPIDAAPADVGGADAPAVDGPQMGDAGKDAAIMDARASTDAVGDSAQAADGAAPPDAAAGADTRAADARADQIADGGDAARPASGCGCGVSTSSGPTWRALLCALAVLGVRRRRRRRTRGRGPSP